MDCRKLLQESHLCLNSIYFFKYKLLFSGDTALCRPMSDEISWIYDKDTAQPCGSE